MSKPPPLGPGQPLEASLGTADVVRAYLVHLITAGGVVFLILAAVEICRPVPRPAMAFLWFVAATLADAIDGPLARRYHVKRFAPSIDGRTIDDIVDYIGFTFLPLLLVWRMGWVPGPADARWFWIAPAAVASLFGFANLQAKDESGGFFRGFPSYWNILALYLGLSAAAWPGFGPWLNAGLLLGFAALTVAPVWFVYPNLAPRRWRPIVLGGAVLWLSILLGMLPWYPAQVPGWLTLASMAYPAFYIWLSIHLKRRAGSDGGEERTLAGR